MENEGLLCKDSIRLESDMAYTSTCLYFNINLIQNLLFRLSIGTFIDITFNKTILMELSISMSKTVIL